LKAGINDKFIAISKTKAEIEFAIDGTILAANENFLTTMGCTLDEIKGKHHTIFQDGPMQAALVTMGKSSGLRLRTTR
jgi:hypothetical protein